MYTDKENVLFILIMFTVWHENTVEKSTIKIAFHAFRLYEFIMSFKNKTIEYHMTTIYRTKKFYYTF